MPWCDSQNGKMKYSQLNVVLSERLPCVLALNRCTCCNFIRYKAPRVLLGSIVGHGNGCTEAASELNASIVLVLNFLR